jgi:hypothetical protein
MEEWSRELGAAMMMEVLREMRIRETVELVTEPGTLRPHWARWSRELEAKAKSEDGTLQPVKQSDTTTMSFVYPD